MRAQIKKSKRVGANLLSFCDGGFDLRKIYSFGRVLLKSHSSTMHKAMDSLY
jgi:hypothetical protein